MKKFTLLLLSLFLITINLKGQYVPNAVNIPNIIKEDNKHENNDINYLKKHGFNKKTDGLNQTTFSNYLELSKFRAASIPRKILDSLCFLNNSFGVYITILNSEENNVKLLISSFTCNTKGNEPFTFKPNNALYFPDYNNSYLLENNIIKKITSDNVKTQLSKINTKYLVNSYAIGRHRLYKKNLINNKRDLTIQVFEENVNSNSPFFGLIFNSKFYCLQPLKAKSQPATGDPCNFGLKAPALNQGGQLIRIN